MSDGIVTGTPTGGGPGTYISVADAKAWLRIEHDRDDTEIATMILAAEQYFQKQAGQDFAVTPPDELAQICLPSLVGLWNENREAGALVELKEIPHGAEAIMIKYRSIS